MDRDDLFQEAYLHGKRLWGKGQPDEPAKTKVAEHPDGAERGFHVWLYGRLLSHIRNLLAEERATQEPLEWTGRSVGYGEVHEDGRSAARSIEFFPVPEDRPTQPPDDAADALCARLPPEASSVVRRLLAGEKVDDIADALGISVRNVKRWVRTAREAMQNDG